MTEKFCKSISDKRLVSRTYKRYNSIMKRQVYYEIIVINQSQFSKNDRKIAKNAITINQQGNVNQNHSDIALHTHNESCNQKII